MLPTGRRIGCTANRRGDEMPNTGCSDKHKRLEKIRQLRRPNWRPKPRLQPRRRGGAEPRPKTDARLKAARRPANHPRRRRQEPDGKAQRNFTDPESRILDDQGRLHPGLQRPGRGRDAEFPVIVAQAPDPVPPAIRHNWLPLLDAIIQLNSAATQRGARQTLVTAGRTAYPAAAAHQGRYVATGRHKKHGTKSATATKPIIRCCCSPTSPQAQASPAIEAATDCASRSSSRCSDKSNRQEASDSSCCAASTR